METNIPTYLYWTKLPDFIRLPLLILCNSRNIYALVKFKSYYQNFPGYWDTQNSPSMSFLAVKNAASV